MIFLVQQYVYQYQPTQVHIPDNMCDFGIKYFVITLCWFTNGCSRFVFIISNKAIVYIYRSQAGNYCWPQVQAPMRRKVHTVADLYHMR